VFHVDQIHGFVWGAPFLESHKANKNTKIKLAESGLDDLGLDFISIEDAHTRIPLEFFRLMKKTRIVLGCVKACQSETFSVGEIVERVEEVGAYVLFEKKL